MLVKTPSCSGASCENARHVYRVWCLSSNGIESMTIDAAHSSSRVGFGLSDRAHTKFGAQGKTLLLKHHRNEATSRLWKLRAAEVECQSLLESSITSTIQLTKGMPDLDDGEVRLKDAMLAQIWRSFLQLGAGKEANWRSVGTINRIRIFKQHRSADS